MEEIIQVEKEDKSGSYLSDILLDKKIVNKVKNKGNLDITPTEGINNSLFKKLTRKNIIYYGIMQGEQPIKIEQATKGFQAPLVNTTQVSKRLSMIAEKDREKIGYIHVNTIQIIIRSTFREGIKTPLEITVQDNRIMNNESKILGKIEGDLGYTAIKFCVNLRFPIPFVTRKFNNSLGIVCNFKQKNLMENGDIPFIVCYRVSYALSNSSISINYENQERIYTDRLFKETSTIIQNDTIQSSFLKEHSSRFNIPLSIAESSTSSIIPSIERPISMNTIFKDDNEIEKLNKQVNELNDIVNSINNRI